MTNVKLQRIENLLSKCINRSDLFSLPSGSLFVVLMKPSLLVSTLRSPERQCNLKFSMPDVSGPKKIENNRIYLRVAKILSGKIVNDEYPYGMEVEVNGRSLSMFGDRSGPMDVTDLIRKEVGSTNQIVVKFTPYLTNYYVATVCAAKASGNFNDVDVSPICDGMLFGEDQIQPLEVTKSRILAYFPHSAEDDDVRLENVEVKLVCPLTLKRLTLPCVSRKCQHISSFDALGFLSLQSAVNKCPICGLRCRTEDLLIDRYIMPLPVVHPYSPTYVMTSRVPTSNRSYVYATKAPTVVHFRRPNKVFRSKNK